MSLGLGSCRRNALFSALVFIGTTAAFVAPPFSTLDTLPAFGVVEDVVIAGAGLAIGVGGIALLVALGRAAIRGIGDLT